MLRQIQTSQLGRYQERKVRRHVQQLQQLLSPGELRVQAIYHARHIPIDIAELGSDAWHIARTQTRQSGASLSDGSQADK